MEKYLLFLLISWMAELVGCRTDRAPRSTLLTTGVLASAPLLSQALFGSLGTGAEDAAAFSSRHSKATRRRKLCDILLLPPPFLPRLAANLNVENILKCFSYLCFPSILELVYAGEINKGKAIYMKATWLMNETVTTGVFISPQGLQYYYLSFSNAFRLWQPSETSAQKISYLGEYCGFFRSGKIEARGRGSILFKVTEQAGGRTRNSTQKLLVFSVFPFLSPLFAWIPR